MYLQKLQQKKGMQLGIYLHRQNHLEPFPLPSRFGVDSTPRQADSDRFLSSFSLTSSMSTLSLLDNVNSTYDTTAATETAMARPGAAEYVDKRKSVSAFFSVFCPNQLANSMTRFASQPDMFSVSQSWGWKSSSLKSEEYIGCSSLASASQGGEEDVTVTASQVPPGRYNSLRVCVVLGLT